MEERGSCTPCRTRAVRRLRDVHTFGTAARSFSDGVRPAPGGVFEIEAPFTLAVRRTVAVGENAPVTVRAL